MKYLIALLLAVLLANIAEAQSPSLSVYGSKDQDVQAALTEIEALKRDVATAKAIVAAARRCGDAGQLYFAEKADNCASIELLRGDQGPKGDAGVHGEEGPIGPSGPNVPYPVCCGTCTPSSTEPASQDTGNQLQNKNAGPSK